MFKALQWEDWLGIALGVWLLASPWALGYSSHEAATMNALVLGAVLVLEELLDLGVHETAEEMIDLAVGAWLIVAPFALGFTQSAAATANSIAVGALTLLFAGWALAEFDGAIAEWWRHRAEGS